MNWVHWALAPLKVALAVLHTAGCSAFGLAVLFVDKTKGDWVMWNVGKRMWSLPLLRVLVGARIRVSVDPRALALTERGKGAVLVANHASLLDIHAAFVASPTPIVFLSKASIRKVPLLGLINERAGTVFVERGNRSSSERAVATLTSTLKNGRSVLVFPEGTRSKHGALQPFKKGAFHLALAARSEVVPMHISGTFELLPPGAFFFRPPRREIWVRIGAPLAQSDEDTPESLMRKAEHAVGNLANLSN
jgi:1-acyl-sn-glycerol-3-phosphate acyltransferase